MKLGVDYEIEIISPYMNGVKQIWTWFGGRLKDGNRVLNNHSNYASDCELLLNSADNEIVGGYSFLYNDMNKLVVNKVESNSID